MKALCCARMWKAHAVAEGLWRGKSAVAGMAQVECILPQRAHGTEGLDSSLWSMWLKTPEKIFGFLEKFSRFNVKFRKVFGYFFPEKDQSLPYRSVTPSHGELGKKVISRKQDFAKRTHLVRQVKAITMNNLLINRMGFLLHCLIRVNPCPSVVAINKTYSVATLYSRKSAGPTGSNTATNCPIIKIERLTVDVNMLLYSLAFVVV